MMHGKTLNIKKNKMHTLNFKKNKEMRKINTKVTIDKIKSERYWTKKKIENT